MVPCWLPAVAIMRILMRIREMRVQRPSRFLTAARTNREHAFDQQPREGNQTYDGADHYVLPVSGKQRRIIGERDGIPHHGKQVGEEYAGHASGEYGVDGQRHAQRTGETTGILRAAGHADDQQYQRTDNRSQREQQA